MRLDSVRLFSLFSFSSLFVQMPIFICQSKKKDREIAKRKKRNHKKMRTRIVFSREKKKWFTTRYGCSRRFYFFFIFNFVPFLVVLCAPFCSLARLYLIRDDKFFRHCYGASYHCEIRHHDMCASFDVCVCIVYPFLFALKNVLFNSLLKLQIVWCFTILTALLPRVAFSYRETLWNDDRVVLVCIYSFGFLLFSHSCARVSALVGSGARAHTHCNTVRDMRAANVKVSFPSVSYHKQSILQWIKLNKWFPLFQLTRCVCLLRHVSFLLSPQIFICCHSYPQKYIFAFQMDAPHFRHTDMATIHDYRKLNRVLSDFDVLKLSRWPECRTLSRSSSDGRWTMYQLVSCTCGHSNGRHFY